MSIEKLAHTTVRTIIDFEPPQYLVLLENLIIIIISNNIVHSNSVISRFFINTTIYVE